MRPLRTVKLAAWVSLPVALGVNAAAQEGVPYCAELERIAGLASTTEKFSAIAGRPRDGDFSDTTLPLSGWVDCSVYGPRTYSCDSVSFGSTAAAEQAIEHAAQQIAACTGGVWRRRPQQSSPSYQILTHAKAPVSMTLSTAESGADSFVVRLIVFTRRD